MFGSEVWVLVFGAWGCSVYSFSTQNVQSRLQLGVVGVPAEHDVRVILTNSQCVYPGPPYPNVDKILLSIEPKL